MEKLGRQSKNHYLEDLSFRVHFHFDKFPLTNLLRPHRCPLLYVDNFSYLNSISLNRKSLQIPHKSTLFSFYVFSHILYSKIFVLVIATFGRHTSFYTFQLNIR